MAPVTFRGKAKLYDLAAALPIIAWYGMGLWFGLPNFLSAYLELSDGPLTLLPIARTLAQLSYLAFTAFLIALLLIRVTPVRKSTGLAPRLTALLGAFLAVGFLYLPPANLSAFPAFVAMALIVGGMAMSIYTLSWLGRSFSIVPEARGLVTDGPYAYVRHPLYACEEIAILGTAMQFAQPWSLLLLIVHLMLQLARMRYEEEVLAAAFPQYAAYAARTARLVPELY